MKAKIKDLTVDEFQSLINKTVKEAMEDFMEDILALSSNSYLKSIEEAREDYKKGNIKYLEEVS
jgi:hypothetical protein